MHSSSFVVFDMLHQRTRVGIWNPSRCFRVHSLKKEECFL